jgi:phytoene dehydrogenase-like protein
MMNAVFDGIILGTGHNALILQAYLSRCGLRTLSVDRAPTPGGGLMTIENPRHAGFRYNTHSFFHRALTAMPWYHDLELEQHGVRYLEPQLNVALIRHDGRALEWWTDIDRTVASCAEFSRRDAETLRHLAEEFQPIVHRILRPEAQSPPLPPELRRQLLERSALGRRLLEISALSPLEFVTRHFESDAVRAGLLFCNGLREIDLRLPGFGHSIPALLASRPMAQMAVGGTAQLAQSLVADIRAHGGELRCGIELRRILVRQGRATGVELTTGEQIEASGFVASGLNPQQTFLDLMPSEAVADTVREKAARFQYNLLAPLFSLHLALKEPPRYAAAAQRPELNEAFMVLIGLERFDQFHEIVAAHERGEIPSAVAWGACPTLFDSSQAPPGQHTAFLWEKLPYALRGDPSNWAKEKEIHSASLLKVWSERAPNLGQGIITDQFALSPADTVTALPNMSHGDLLVGSFANNQVGYHRPFAGAGCYRTPVPGLYLCGGSTHPGGNITGLCGYNAARVIAADLSKEIWWNPPDVEQALAAL